MPLPARIPRAPIKRANRQRDGMSSSHLAAVRTLGCVLCGQIAEAHHLMGLELGRGLGRKNADQWAIPLCQAHHASAHAAGDDGAYLRREGGIDARGLARALWAARGSVEAMDRIVYRTRWRVA